MKLTNAEIEEAWLRYLSKTPVCNRDAFAAELQRVADRIPDVTAITTLRDEFAMAAMPAFLNLGHTMTSVSELCYMHADAMMVARKKHSAIS